jgi:non-heme chloroperoxidase
MPSEHCRVGPSIDRLELATGAALTVARSGPRGAVPLVLLPAYADSWWSWSRLLPSLAAERDVIAIDPRGHGGSDRPACCYRVADSAADIVAALAALDVSRAILVGHSGSCFAARQVAADHCDLVAALVLISSPVTLDRTELAEVIAEVAELEDPVPESFVRDFQSGTTHVPLPEEFLDGLVAESRRMPARIWRDVLDGLLDFDDTTRLASIPQPTTLIWGDRDPIVSLEEQERLATVLPDASRVVLPDTGHCPHWERPELVVEILESVAQRTI